MAIYFHIMSATAMWDGVNPQSRYNLTMCGIPVGSDGESHNTYATVVECRECAARSQRVEWYHDGKKRCDRCGHARFCDDGSCWYCDFDLDAYLRGEIEWKS